MWNKMATRNRRLYSSPEAVFLFEPESIPSFSEKFSEAFKLRDPFDAPKVSGMGIDQGKSMDAMRPSSTALDLKLIL